MNKKIIILYKLKIKYFTNLNYNLLSSFYKLIFSLILNSLTYKYLILLYKTISYFLFFILIIFKCFL